LLWPGGNLGNLVNVIAFTPEKRVQSMCDYSLHAVASRPAKVGDKLVTTKFRNTLTRGFSAVDEPDVAVCLLPGTELVFEADVQHQLAWLTAVFFGWERWSVGYKVGRFREINLDNPATHHDAVEFPDGQVVLLTCLRPGQHATVLQLPAAAYASPAAKTQERAEPHVRAR
jgi:hypothetical protein